MRRAFILTPEFEKAWARMGLGDAEPEELQNMLVENLEAGDVIPGMNGARKVRIPLEGRGKSGGGHVVYVDIVVREMIYLVTAYTKNVQTDLSEGEKKTLRKLVDIINKED